jgi:hypothetical protein
MLKLYRGLDADGKSVVFLDGDNDELLTKSAENFTGDSVGDPAVGTIAECIGEVSDISIKPVFEVATHIVEGLAKADDDDISCAIQELNKSIAKRGINILSGTAQEKLFKSSDEDDAEERTVYSVVLEPNDGENGAPLEPDTQGDVYGADVIEKTAHGWMRKGGQIGLMHELGISEKVAVLETYIAPVEFELSGHEIRKGSWLLKTEVIDDVLWKAVKNETLGAYSVGGFKTSIDVE